MYKAQLTEDEYNSLVRAQKVAIDAAQDPRQTPSQVRTILDNARSIMNGYTNTIPGQAARRKDDPDAAFGISILLERKMDEFVSQFTDVGKEPSAAEVNKEASRLIMQIRSEGTSFSIFGYPFFKPDFEGIAVMKDRLTPEQRSSVIVDFGVMTERQKFDWTKRFNDAGIAPSENMLEQLGGAIAMQDQDRIKILLTIRVKE